MITKYKFLENYAPFIISISTIITLTERGIYLSPKEFKLSHISIGLVGFHEYYNVTLLTD